MNSQPIFQVFNQVLDQVVGLIIFQSCIIASTLVYHSHKHHTSVPVPFLGPCLLAFSLFHIIINFESTGNHVSYLIAEFWMDI